MKTKFLIILTSILIISCSTTTPTKIGANTYYSAKTNTAGIFGDVSTVVGTLMSEGNLFCENISKEFQLVTMSTNQNIPGVRLGGASLTFQCVDKAGEVLLRPDKGITTIEQR